jgi:hypothetical protein
MNPRFFNCRKMDVRTTAAMVVLLVASCAPPYSPPPQQVQASNPTVTYKYHTDQDLLQVDQTATIFCNQYQSVAQAGSFTNDPDGSKVVVFQCVRAMAPAVPQTPFNPNLTYNYRSDQDLLDASRNAQSYCASNGRQQVVSDITSNANGTRVVTFRCSP